MKKILVIEDSATIRENIRALLGYEGYTTLGASNGLDGLTLAQKEQPDLIICDIMMPRLDGYETLAALRRDPATASIPLIFLTAKGERADLRLGMELGADDYLPKPFTSTELLAAVTTRLGRQEHTRELRQQIRDLQERHEAQDELFNTASLELKTPLATMKLALRLLREKPSRDARARYLRVLEEACGRENELLNNLLELYRLEADGTPLIREEILLLGWLPGLLEGFALKARQRNQIFYRDLPRTAPNLVSNRVVLERILSELFTNAHRFTRAGGTIRFGLQTPSALHVALNVTNEAEIPESDLPLIFDPFYRSSASQGIIQAGAGLGLTLVRTLVSRLGGEIQVTSMEGQTTFTVVLPSDGAVFSG
ncbi:hybrid sensor histidine kinase/response regulator [Anthocerotibacter panamensis]|uniref:hybrid sensor histidine kinase/response regulator n=1 Tax=Anthocerotibacter panamensis TaxID=2857077 RepID=UPI001C4062F7|nr:hybrid sensor histidine kinase/response regulator [Anthocerotibacter panamensis]